MKLPRAPRLVSPPSRRLWFGVGFAVLLFPLVVLGVIALGVASYFHPSADTRALRNGLMKASGVEWRQSIGLNIGSATLGAVRAGLSFVPLDSKARAVVRSVRGVEVSIYELAAGTKSPDSAALLDAADTVLSDRGWERLVCVLDREELVGVYVPRKAILARQMKCCVLVFDGRQMIVVSARVDAEPMLRCLQNQSNLPAGVRSLATR